MAKPRSNVLWHLCSTLWKYAEGRRRWVLLYLATSFLATQIHLLGPVIMARLMDAVQRLSGQQLEDRAYWLLGGYALVGVIFWLLHGPSRVLECIVAFHLKQRFQLTLLERVTSLPPRWHRHHHSGETIDQVGRASTALFEFAENGFEITQLISRFVGSLLLLTWFMPGAGVAVLVVTLVVMATVALFDRTLVRQYDQLNKAYNGVAASIQDYLTNISTVISLRLEKRVVREVDHKVTGILPLYRGNIVVNELKWFTTARLVDGSHALVVLFLVVNLARGHSSITVGTVYAVSEYLRWIGETFFQFTWKYGWLVQQSARVRGAEHIHQAFEEQVQSTARAGLPPSWSTLDVRAVEFRHQAGDRPALELAHLRLVRGRTYALVGESGSGKSTLLSLLRGMHPCPGAHVTCDGELMPCGLAHVHHHTSLIPQDPEIFAGSIRFNVTLGMDVGDDRVLAALQDARFAPVLARLPRGLDTDVAEKGVSLSGGERQRLAVARGLFFADEIDSQIVLLDEPTSSVDVVNERAIYETVLRGRGDRCVISALHKFHLLDLFDEVLVFAGGRLVEQGSAAELRAAGGHLGRLLGALRQDEPAPALHRAANKKEEVMVL